MLYIWRPSIFDHLGPACLGWPRFELGKTRFVQLQAYAIGMPSPHYLAMACCVASCKTRALFGAKKVQLENWYDHV